MTTIVVNHGSSPSQNDDESVEGLYGALQCRERTLQSGYGTFQGGSIGGKAEKAAMKCWAITLITLRPSLRVLLVLTLLRFRGARFNGARGQSIAPVSFQAHNLLVDALHNCGEVHAGDYSHRDTVR